MEEFKLCRWSLNLNDKYICKCDYSHNSDEVDLFENEGYL